MPHTSSRLLIGLLLISLLCISGCGREESVPEETIPRVKYFTVDEQASGQSRRISGRVVAADTSVLSFGVSGTIEEVLVKTGDTVTEGQVLARIDTQTLQLAVEQSRAELNIARARAVEAEQAYERTRSLFESRAASDSELEAVTAEYASARENVRAVQTQLERQQRDLQRTELTAPFSGRVAERAIDPFQEISATSEAIVLQTNNALKVEVSVPETLIREVDYGQVVEVTFPTQTETRVNGSVDRIGARAESGNAFPVSVLLAGTDADLRPGMTASVTFNFNAYLEGRTSFLIPLSALAIEAGVVRQFRHAEVERVDNTAPVMLINSNGVLELRQISVGELRGNQLEVYTGLEGGDNIVSAGVSFLREGMQVELWNPEAGLIDG